MRRLADTTGRVQGHLDDLMADGVDETTGSDSRVVRPSRRSIPDGSVAEPGSLYGEHVASRVGISEERARFDTLVERAFNQAQAWPIAPDLACDPFASVTCLGELVAFGDALAAYTQGVSSTTGAGAQAARYLILAIAGLTYDWDMRGSMGHHVLGDFMQVAADVQSGTFDAVMQMLLSGLQPKMDADGKRVEGEFVPLHGVNHRTQLCPGKKRALGMSTERVRGMRAGEDFALDNYLMFLGLAGEEKGFFYDDVYIRLKPLEKFAEAIRQECDESSFRLGGYV